MVTRDTKNDKIYRCDDKCTMFKGFSLCSHVIAAAEDNGDLKSFLDSVADSCTPNLSAIANDGMPSGTGRKGGVPKRKRSKAQHVQSRSMRQCLQQTVATTKQSNSLSSSSQLQTSNSRASKLTGYSLPCTILSSQPTSSRGLNSQPLDPTPKAAQLLFYNSSITSSRVEFTSLFTTL